MNNILTKLTLMCLVILVVGCSYLAVPKYDATEYQTLIQIAVQSDHGTCTVEQTTALVTLSTFLKYYTEYLPHNDLMWEGAVELDASIRGLHTTPQPYTPRYCELRLKLIHTMATTLAQASGSKVRS